MPLATVHAVAVRGAALPSPLRLVRPALRSMLTGPMVRLSMRSSPTAVGPVPRAPPLPHVIVGGIATPASGPPPSRSRHLSPIPPPRERPAASRQPPLDADPDITDA